MSGYSTATVSRVMHDGTGFSDATRKTVLEVAARLGWVPNHSARSLARRQTGIVGLLFSDFASEESEQESESALYVDQVIRGAERAATTAGDAILIGATRGRDGLELARSLVGKVDGLVVLAGSLPLKHLADIAKRVPVVLMATHTAPHGLDFVGADNRGGLRSATEHLIASHDVDELAFVAGPAQSPDSKERFVGFARALTDAGLSAPKSPRHTAPSPSSGERARSRSCSPHGVRRRVPSSSATTRWPSAVSASSVATDSACPATSRSPASTTSPPTGTSAHPDHRPPAHA